MPTDAELVQASIDVFALGLGLLAVIWGAKWLVRLLVSGRNE